MYVLNVLRFSIFIIIIVHPISTAKDTECQEDKTNCNIPQLERNNSLVNRKTSLCLQFRGIIELLNYEVK